MSDTSIKEIAEKHFDAIWLNLRIQNHIVTGLSRSRNSKQALEKAEHFKVEVRREIIDDLVDWYTKVFKDDKIADIHIEIMTRINGELAKMGLNVFTE